MQNAESKAQPPESAWLRDTVLHSQFCIRHSSFSIRPGTTRMPKADTTAAAFDTFFAGVGAKDKLSIEKHLAAIDAEADPGHGRAWRRLAVALRRLAPLAVQTVGQQVIQFFVPDGKYRMQVFTLEDKRDGALLVYLPNVVDQAIKEKVLGKPAGKAGKVAGKGSSFFDDEDDAAQPVEYPV